ncbi:MAG: hypothetical protein AMXMBFR64_47960 [Myxococcales bacterium]
MKTLIASLAISLAALVGCASTGTTGSAGSAGAAAEPCCDKADCKGCAEQGKPCCDKPECQDKQAKGDCKGACDKAAKGECDKQAKADKAAGCTGDCDKGDCECKKGAVAASGALPADLVGTEATCAVSGKAFAVEADSTFSQHDGKTYVFCCPGCKKKFDADPAAFAK